MKGKKRQGIIKKRNDLEAYDGLLRIKHMVRIEEIGRGENQNLKDQRSNENRKARLRSRSHRLSSRRAKGRKSKPKAQKSKPKPTCGIL